MPSLSVTDLRVRQAILETLAAGGTPTRIGVMQSLELAYADVASSYAGLAAGHVIVLDSGTGEVWMAMPFSAVPTAFRVTVDGHAVWANCVWDAYGVAAALNADVSFVSPCPASGVPVSAGVRLDVPFADAGAVAYVGVPAVRWWDDIGYT
ncbi:MAG: hypothetical protein KA371_04580 [Acidobacteria bacterium]|nr:hypothetical protein [Acidobacteriota bacterium]